MKHAALLLALLVGTPVWAGQQINTNDVRRLVNADNADEWRDRRDDNVEDRRERYEDDCVTVEHRDAKLSSEGCSDKNGKSNRSVHGDDNPGKGHDKNKHKGHDDGDDYNIKVDRDSYPRVEHYSAGQGKGKKSK